MKYFFLFLFKLLIIKSDYKFHNYVKKQSNKMSIESINRQFEVFMRDMVNAHECAQENIESDFRRLLRVTVNSCAAMYGFSAEEALKRLNSSGEIIEAPVVAPIQQKESEKAEKLRLKELEKAEKLRLKELEKAEKLRLKEFEKTQKELVKEFEKTEALRRKEFEKSKKNRLQALEKAEKTNESSERTLMKGEDASSKAIEKAEKLKLKKKKTVTKKVEASDCESLASTVLMTDSEDEEPFVRFQNIPLITEINSIRDVKKFKNYKKLSAGVKLARQILDI